MRFLICAIVYFALMFFFWSLVAAGNVKLKVRTNPHPCKHTVVTLDSDSSKVKVWHDSEFGDDYEEQDEEWKAIHKGIKKKLKQTGKKFSESKDDFHDKELEIDDEDEQ